MRRASRLSVAAAVAALTGVLAACGPPPVEEVIPYGVPAQGERWCAVLTNEEVAAAIGEDQLERVRQSGELRPGRARSKVCNVLWADGEQVRQVASVGTVFLWEDYGGEDGAR